MAVVIRLNVRGRKHLAFHKLVVADSRAPRDGRHIEILGHYDPLKDPAEFVVNAERAKYWLERGARPSEKVAALFKKAGIMPVKAPSKPKKAKPAGAARRKPSAGTVAKAKATRAKAAAKKAAPAKPKKKAVKKPEAKA
jgi:small subunit ribosomal protein S16